MRSRSSPARARPIALLALGVSACFALGACYTPSAARRAGRMLSDAWDTDARGPWVALTGPALTLVASGDFLLHALVPLDYDGYFLVDRREPEHKWFRAYRGPMLPLDHVAVLCKRKRSIHVAEIQGRFDAEPREARHEAWHFPECIEAVPGIYRLKVEYYSRSHYDTNSHLATFTTESTAPAMVDWEARAGAIYRLDARLGAIAPAPESQRPGSTIRTIPPSRRKLGTSQFLLDVGEWYAVIEPVATWSELDAPVLEYRAAWRRYEERR